MDSSWRRLTLAATLLALAQVAHTVAALASGPKLPEGTNEGALGEPLGLLALIASIVAIGGAARRSSWAPWLTGATGVSVAVGFVLYHGIPVHSWFTNTYWGRADVLDWSMVVLCVAAGAWALMVSREFSPSRAPTTAAA